MPELASEARECFLKYKTTHEEALGLIYFTCSFLLGSTLTDGCQRMDHLCRQLFQSSQLLLSKTGTTLPLKPPAC